MIGTQVGQFQITQEIGDGGHAFVFRGEGPGGKRVAIKMLKPSVADEDNLEKRFIIEKEALKRLSHPNIVQFEDYIYQNGYHYLVLEYMDQGSIENLIKSMGSVPARYAVPLFNKVLEGIEYSHQKGYIHRDLKPNNILINSEGEAKLTDFGITKVMGGQNLTKKGFVLGTTLYMAPEFISQGIVSVKTDIYALGVTFYEVLTNRKPFEFERDDEPLVSYARRVCTGTPVSPSTYEKSIPPELERIIMKSISQDPNKRYKSARELQKDLVKHFPDLVNRDIVIDFDTRKAKTRYQSIVDLGLGQGQAKPGLSSTLTSVGSGMTPITRATIATIVAMAVLAVTFLRPQLVGMESSPAVYGGGAGLALLMGLVLFFALPKPKPISAAAGGRGGRGGKGSATSSSDEPSSSGDWKPEDSAIPEFDLEDTIPFHDGFQKAQPFKMTDVSELKAYLAVIAGPDKGRRFGLRPVSRIGRDLRLDIRPHDPEISRHHAVVTFTGTGFVAEDLGSTNGTFVNEEKLVGKRAMKHGDVLRTGASSMRFEYENQAAAGR